MTKSQQAYPTDLNDTEWARIAPCLPEPSTTGAPRRHSWRLILNAIFYVVKNGCVWRALPHDFPAWQTAYHYFRLFRKNGVWEQVNAQIREAVREQAGNEPQASAMIADAQSAKSADGGEHLGLDGGQWVRGRKRNLLVDSLGLVVLAKVTAANVQDVHAGQQLFSAVAQKPALLTRLEKIFADGGYRGDLEAWVQENLPAVLEIVLKLGDQKGFQVLPKRWIVERTFAWISRNRRLARDYERLAESSEAFIYVAMIRLGLRRLARV